MPSSWASEACRLLETSADTSPDGSPTWLPEPYQDSLLFESSSWLPGERANVAGRLGTPAAAGDRAPRSRRHLRPGDRHTTRRPGYPATGSGRSPPMTLTQLPPGDVPATMGKIRCPPETWTPSKP